MEKVHERLEGWKVKSLSLAGRATHASSVLSSMPIYAMQTTKLPQSVLHDLDKHTRRCVWGSNDTRKRIHLVNWPSVCQTKDHGGLGLKQAGRMNQAMLTKLAWRLINGPTALWSRLMRSKYGGERELLNVFQQKGGASHIWRGMVDLTWDA